jgi:hypothetical protein
LVTRGSFVHVTSAPAMIGYTRKMFRDFVGITRRRRTNVFFFCPRIIVQNIKHVWSAKTLFRDKRFCFRTKIHRLRPALGYWSTLEPSWIYSSSELKGRERAGPDQFWVWLYSHIHISGIYHVPTSHTCLQARHDVEPCERCSLQVLQSQIYI